MNLIECDRISLSFDVTPGELDALWRICETARENASRLDLIAYDIGIGDIDAAADYLTRLVHDGYDPVRQLSLKMNQDIFDSLYATVGSCDEFRSRLDLEKYALDEGLIRQMHERLRVVLSDMVERFEAGDPLAYVARGKDDRPVLIEPISAPRQ